jgi:AcrR family transcriptional regulator
VSNKAQKKGGGLKPRGRTDQHVRADARRNIDTLLKTAKPVFATSGVNAPIREIAEKAGVGVGTIYRHFPQRSDLIAAVFSREIDACADAAAILVAEHEPGEALAQWMQRYAVRSQPSADLQQPSIQETRHSKISRPISKRDSCPHFDPCLKRPPRQAKYAATSNQTNC